MTDEAERKLPGSTSDGYHTFDELYEHRHALFIALCFYMPPGSCWRSRQHSDGSSYDGWFVLGIHKGKGFQISYHLPIALWDQCDPFTETLDRAPAFDGHTSSDVLTRLRELAQMDKE